MCEVGRASVCTPPKHDKSLTEPKMSATLSFLTSLIAFLDGGNERKKEKNDEIESAMFAVL